MNREYIEIDDEKAIGFIKHGEKFLEYWHTFFSLDFPELKEEDFDALGDWLDLNCDFTHKTEYQFLFPIAYWDNKFLIELDPPESIRDIFKAAISYGKSLNKDKKEEDKIVPVLFIHLPKIATA